MCSIFINFRFIQPTIDVGFERPLLESDVWETHSRDKTEALYTDFMRGIFTDVIYFHKFYNICGGVYMCETH